MHQFAAMAGYFRLQFMLYSLQISGGFEPVEIYSALRVDVRGKLQTV